MQRVFNQQSGTCGSFERPRRWLARSAVCLWAVLVPGAWAEPPPLVVEVLERAPAAAAERCAYTRLKIDPDGSKQERYDPTGGGPRWTLLEVDERAPTDAELAAYRRKADDRQDRRHPLRFDLRELVEPSSWQRLPAEPDVAVFRFALRPFDDISAAVARKLRGTLVIDPATAQPRSVRVENTEPGYVAPFVRVAEYVQELTFRWSDSVGAAVPVETVTRRRGRVLGVASMDRDRRLVYRDYECAPLASEPGARPAG